MSDGKHLNFDIDMEELTKEFDSIKEEVAKALQDGAESLANMTHAKVNELATDKLNTRAKTYKDNVTFEEVDKGVWVVTLLEPAMWIEEGLQPYDMKDTHLAKNAKVGKDGQRYKHIPFEHSKKPSEQSEKAQSITNEIKSELKARKIPFRKLELGKDGSPRVGLLHRFSVDSGKPSARSKSPTLQNVQVYQNKTASGAVRKDIMTFRTISDKSDNWQHPGTQAAKIFEEAYSWAESTWEREILPNIMASFDKK